MSIRKTLTKLVLGTAIATSTFVGYGCNGMAVPVKNVEDKSLLLKQDVDYSRYEFNGKIGDDKVWFFQSGNLNTLDVTKPNGRTIEYVDNKGDDLKLEYVEISDIPRSEYLKFTADTEMGAQILEKAQEKFDGYLKSIRIIKREREFDYIKNIDNVL